MRYLLPKLCFATAVVFVVDAAHASEELIKMSQNPKDWVMPTGNYANHRYSKLNKITTENAAKLQVAWTFSTGVLRGHEGGPLVIGNIMYIHGPFPNPVFALDLSNDGKILWRYEPKQDPNVIPIMCCDTVNRGVAYGDGKIFLHQADDAGRPRRQDRQGGLVSQERRSVERRDRYLGSDGDQGQDLRRHLGWRVCRSRFDDGLRHQDRQASMARLFDRPRQRNADRSAEDD
jgi:hypothetical protein